MCCIFLFTQSNILLLNPTTYNFNSCLLPHLPRYHCQSFLYTFTHSHHTIISVRVLHLISVIMQILRVTPLDSHGCDKWYKLGPLPH